MKLPLFDGLRGPPGLYCSGGRARRQQHGVARRAFVVEFDLRCPDKFQLRVNPGDDKRPLDFPLIRRGTRNRLAKQD